MNLHHDFSASHRVVMHVRIKISETAGREYSHFALVEAVSHTYHQVGCILSVLERPTEAFEWLERSVSTGFACWPFFCQRSLSQESARSSRI